MLDFFYGSCRGIFLALTWLEIRLATPKKPNARSQTPQQNLSFLRVAWLGFEQHLEDASGQGSPANAKSVRASRFTKRRFASVGQIEPCCEKQAKTGPVKSTTYVGVQEIFICSICKAGSDTGLIFVLNLRSINFKSSLFFKSSSITAG